MVRNKLAREREFVEEGIRKADIKEFLRDSLQKAKFGGVDIRRTALRTRMIIYAERPGLIIGRRGRNIKDLTEVLEERYGFENLQIEVEEIPIPELSPQIMASRIAAMLKAGRPFRRSAYMNLQKIIEAGAQGVEITISGKIRGERARTVRFVQGAITKCGEPAKQVQEGLAIADLKQGMMGIKVKIMPPDTRMPDRVDLGALEEVVAEEVGEEVVAEEVGEEVVAEEVGEEVVAEEVAEEAVPKEAAVEDIGEPETSEAPQAEPQAEVVETSEDTEAPTEEEEPPPVEESVEETSPKVPEKDEQAEEAKPRLRIEVKDIPEEESGETGQARSEPDEKPGEAGDQEGRGK